jgi:hypothetical protein
MSRAYARSAEAAGDRIELIVHEELGHFEHLDPHFGGMAKRPRVAHEPVTITRGRRQEEDGDG